MKPKVKKYRVIQNKTLNILKVNFLGMFWVEIMRSKNINAIKVVLNGINMESQNADIEWIRK